MKNQDSLKFFEDLSHKTVTPTTTKIRSCNDFSQYDADFICRYVSEQSEVLDLATGTGITLNKYYSKVKSIVAVEKFESFAKLIVQAPNVQVVISDIQDFDTEQKFDLVLMFGIVCYFNEKEVVDLYKKYLKYLKPNGKLIVKCQFGINETVDVNGFSEELQCNYYSQYRYLQTEIDILKSVGLNDIEVFDIYPPSCNRWSNTHFYALVANLK